MSLVRIHYLRPPDREEVFEQELLLDSDRVKVTLARNVEFDPPIRIRDRVVLETGSHAVWFTFPGAWHDVGRFHRADGSFTGFYANVLTPPVFRRPDGPGRPGRWDTTDLFLDVWMSPDGRTSLLDREQLDEALRRGWIEPATAERAVREGTALLARAEAGAWPPEVVREWTLERALAQSSSPSTR